MAYQGEYFVERYGAKAAERTPPIAKMMAAGLPVGAGTDATRVASYNPWVSLNWLVTGKTVGGLGLYPGANRLSREQALRLWTHENTWFSNEVGTKGQIKAGQLADLAMLSGDYFIVAASQIPHLRAVLTILGGAAVHGEGDYAPSPPPCRAPCPTGRPSPPSAVITARPNPAPCWPAPAAAPAPVMSTAMIMPPHSAPPPPPPMCKASGARSGAAAGLSDLSGEPP